VAPTQALALTGYGQSADRARSVDVGFDDHLVKRSISPRWSATCRWRPAAAERAAHPRSG